MVLEWFNPDCPFIRKHHQHHRTMDDLAARYGERAWCGWRSTPAAAGKQGAGLERNQKALEEYQMTFPVLLDESGTVGKAYGAKTTPHMFVIAPMARSPTPAASTTTAAPSTLGKTNHVAAALERTSGRQDRARSRAPAIRLQREVRFLSLPGAR